MRSKQSLGRALALVLIAFAVAASPSLAQTFWSGDASISDGDVNDTFTSQNFQRFAAVDDSNNLYIAFYDNRNKVGSDNNFEIYFRRFTYNFGSPGITRVTNAYNPSKYPSLAVLNWGAGDSATANDSGRVYLAWQDSRLFEIPVAGEPKSYVIFFRTYQSRGGAGFGPEIQVSPYDSLNVASAPSITVDPSHRAWIVWHKANNGSNPELYYAVYDANARTMGAVTQLTNDVASSNSAAITATRTGEIHVVWVDTRTGGNQLWWKQYSGGAWSTDTQIAFSSGSASRPSLTADYQGRLHLVWVDNRVGGSNEIFYKEYVPGVGWDAVDTQLTTQPGSNQTEPYVDADPMGNVYVVWQDQRNGASNPDIYYKDRKGGAWSSDLELVSNLTDGNMSVIQRQPGITHDGFGTTYVAWSDERLPDSQGRNQEVFYKYGLFNVTAAPVAPPAAASRLLRAYPNPFNPDATVHFRLDRDGSVTLRAYDVQGRLVRTLVDGYLAAGERNVRWDGRDDAGRQLPSGSYFLRLDAPGASLTRTVSLIK